MGRQVKVCLAVLVGLALAARASAADVPPWADAWEQLKAGSPQAASAREILLKGGEPASRFLVAKLLEKPDPAYVERLVGTLDHSNFKTREEAAAALLALGKTAEPAIRAAAEKHRSLEIGMRLQPLLKQLAASKGAPGAEAARQRLAIEVIEAAGMPAIASLREVAAGTVWPDTRDAARAAVERVFRAEITRLFDAADASARKGQLDSTGLARAANLMNESNTTEDEAFAYRFRRRQAIADAAEKAAALARQLREKPGDLIARNDLAKITLVALDDPAAAAAIVGNDEGPLPAMARLAAKTDLTAAQRRQLAEWYAGQAKDAGPAGQVDMLRRAQGHWKAWLAQAQREGVDPEQVAAARERLAAIDEEIADVGMSQSGWQNLLTLVDTGRHVVAGDWSRTDASLVLKAGDFSKLVLPVTPEGSYELKVSLVRTTGSDGIFIAVPVNGRAANLNVGGWGNTITGFEQINGVMADGQEDTAIARKEGIANGKLYEYVIRVDAPKNPAGDAVVRITENGKKLVDWRGDAKQLGVHGVWRLNPPANLGLGAHKSDVTFKTLRLRTIDGKAKIDRDLKVPKKAPPPEVDGLNEAVEMLVE